MVYPKSNLSPESQPWGRSVEDRLIALESGLSRSLADLNSTLKQLSSSVQLVSQRSQISGIDTGAKAVTAPAGAGVKAFNTLTTEPQLTFLAYYKRTLVSYGCHIQAAPSSSVAYGLARVLVNTVAQSVGLDILVAADGPNGPGDEFVSKSFMLETTPGSTYALRMETGYIQGTASANIDYSKMFIAAVGIGIGNVQ